MDLLGCDLDGVQQLPDLRIVRLRLVLDLADEVNWVLDFVGVFSLFTLDDDGRAYHSVGFP